MRRRAAVLVFAIAAAAFASPDDAPQAELPLGAWVRAGRPLDVRVRGGADRVRATGTPWALPQGERGDEFLLQMPAAVSESLELTVEREGIASRVAVPVTVLPERGKVTALFGDATAAPGATGVRVRRDSLPSIRDAWLLFDDVAGDLSPLPEHDREAVRSGVIGGEPFFWPLLAPPDPAAFRATAEAAAVSPLLPRDAATVLLLLAATELALIALLRFRRDGPWARAAWLGAPAVAAAFAVAWLWPPGAALVATPVAVDENTAVLYVRIAALRDGTGTLSLPEGANGPWAIVRYASDDATADEVTAGPEVRVTLRAGESRVVACPIQHEKEILLVPFPALEEVAAGPATHKWLAASRLVPAHAMSGVHARMRPAGRGIRVLPGVWVQCTRSPDK